MQSRSAAKDQQAAEAQAYEQEQQQDQMDAAAQQAVDAQQAAAAPAPAAASAGDDLMTQIQNLATMHSQGILSDDEFAAAKAKLLT